MVIFHGKMLVHQRVGGVVGTFERSKSRKSARRSNRSSSTDGFFCSMLISSNFSGTIGSIGPKNIGVPNTPTDLVAKLSHKERQCIHVDRFVYIDLYVFVDVYVIRICTCTCICLDLLNLYSHLYTYMST